MDFYVLLIMPHLLALAGLAVYAYRSSLGEPSDNGFGRWEDNGGEQPPGGPEPEPPFSAPPLISPSAPRRRLRVGERLAELYPRRSRREHAPPEQPKRPRVKS